MRVHLLCPGPLAQRTGGYLYDARVVQELRALGDEVVVHEIEGRWPFPSPAPALPSLPPGEPVLADGLLWTGLGPDAAALAGRNPVAVLVHSPLFREASVASDLRERERRALRAARRVVVTSPWTARDLGIDAVLAAPGTDPAPTSEGSGTGRILTVATLTPRKGHRVLLEALAQLRGNRWSLSCAGAFRDPAEADRIRDHIHERGLAGRVELLGDLDRDGLQDQYARADLVVHAAWYEAWGMGLCEALARGIPVISTPAGALDTLPADCAVRVPPGDPNALAGAIFEVLTDTTVHAALRGAARRCVLPSWGDTVGTLRQVLQGMA